MCATPDFLKLRRATGARGPGGLRRQAETYRAARETPRGQGTQHSQGLIGRLAGTEHPVCPENPPHDPEAPRPGLPLQAPPGGHSPHAPHTPSDNTSYASATCLNFLSASSLFSGFLSGCHFSASFLYLKKELRVLITSHFQGGA